MRQVQPTWRLYFYCICMDKHITGEMVVATADADDIRVDYQMICARQIG